LNCSTKKSAHFKKIVVWLIPDSGWPCDETAIVAKFSCGFGKFVSILQRRV
jgi:hypothetical protein